MQDKATGSLILLGEKRLLEAERTGVPTFRVGEVVEVKGGRFRIAALGTKMMRLHGVPIDTPLGRDAR